VKGLRGGPRVGRQQRHRMPAPGAAHRLALLALQVWVAQAATIGHARSATVAFLAQPHSLRLGLPGDLGAKSRTHLSRAEGKRATPPQPGPACVCMGFERVHSLCEMGFLVRASTRKSASRRAPLRRTLALCACILSWTDILGMRKTCDERSAGAPPCHHARALEQQHHHGLSRRRLRRIWQ